MWLSSRRKLKSLRQRQPLLNKSQTVVYVFPLPSRKCTLFYFTLDLQIYSPFVAENDHVSFRIVSLWTAGLILVKDVFRTIRVIHWKSVKYTLLCCPVPTCMRMTCLFFGHCRVQICVSGQCVTLNCWVWLCGPATPIHGIHCLRPTAEALWTQK